MKPVLYGPNNYIDVSKDYYIPVKYVWSGSKLGRIIFTIEEYDHKEGSVSYYKNVKEFPIIMDSYSSTINIPTDIYNFKNENIYKFTAIVTYNDENIAGGIYESDESNDIYIGFFPTPIIVFSNNITDGKKIESSNIELSLTYNSISEYVALQTFEIEFFDSNKNLIKKSNTLYPGNTFIINGMVNNNVYYIRANAITKISSNTFEKDITTGYVRVFCSYDADSINIPIFAKNKNNGTIEIDISSSILSNIDNIDFFRLKRKESNGVLWETIHIVKCDDYSNNIMVIDNTPYPNTFYQYIIVPVFKNGTEGQYSYSNISNDVECSFNGISISDINETWTAFANLSFNRKRNRNTSVVETLGSKFPVVVSNGNINYDSGSITAFFCDFNCNELFNIKTSTKYRNKLYDFLNNSLPKILKTEDGLNYIVQIDGEISESDSQSKMPETSINWVQIGDVNNYNDLYYNGFIGV